MDNIGEIPPVLRIIKRGGIVAHRSRRFASLHSASPVVASAIGGLGVPDRSLVL